MSLDGGEWRERGGVPNDSAAGASNIGGAFGYESDESFMRDRLLYGVRCRDNAGFGLWQYAYKGNA